MFLPFLAYGDNTGQEVALVTGCSSGIGFHIATHLSNKNYKVYAGLLDPDRDTTSLKNATSNPDSLIPIKLDITQSEDIKAAIQQIIDQEGHIDVLINNAAYGLFGPVDSCTMQEIENQFKVNLFGTIELTHTVIPFFRKQLKGKIICISSLRALKSSSVQGVYSATKSALEAVGGAWASTLFPWNIHVTLVEPGATSTSFPSNMVFGSFYDNQDNPYPNVLENSLNLVNEWNEDRTIAQDPKEIALLVERLINDKAPPLRVQTSSETKDEVMRFCNDPTGAVWLEEEQALMKKWLLLQKEEAI